MPPTPTSFLDLRARQLANQPSWRVRKVVHVPITLRSGRVAACDPLSQPDRAPFEREIPHGIYSVYLYLDAASGDVGYAELRLRDTPVERFELATIPGQDASTLSPTEIYGYMVDSGNGCFADPQMLSTTEVDPEHVSDNVIADGFAILTGDTDATGVAFKAGDGDGTYATYYGFDASGELACVVSDFAMFPSLDPARATELEQRHALLVEACTPFSDRLHQSIGAALLANGFSDRDLQWSVDDDGHGVMTVGYQRDDLSFEVRVSLRAGRTTCERSNVSMEWVQRWPFTKLAPYTVHQKLGSVPIFIRSSWWPRRARHHSG
jgi:hypothetical protein